MQKPKQFDFYKEFDETYFTPTNTWNVCCEGYFNSLGVEKNQVLLDAIKPYFGHVYKEHKLSLLGAMIAFGEIYYYQNFRFIYEKKKRFANTDTQEADKYLFLKIHADSLSKMCKYSDVLTKEFEQMHSDINQMAHEMQYVPNVANMPDLPARLGIPKK
jgi:hypothetical protein